MANELTPWWERALIKGGVKLGDYLNSRPFMRDSDIQTPGQLADGLAQSMLRDVYGIDPETGQAGIPGVGFGGITAKLFHGGTLGNKPQGMLWGSEGPDLANLYADMRKARGDAPAVYPYSATYDAPFDADVLPGTVTIGAFANEMAQQARNAGRDIDLKSLAKDVARLKSIAKAEEAGPHFARHDFWYRPSDYFGAEGERILRGLFEKAGFDSVSLTERGNKTIGVLRPEHQAEAIGGTRLFQK
jgi:hypothetical protein